MKDNALILNRKEFVKLIKRYETITLEEIQAAWETSQFQNGHWVAQSLTGFGGSISCTLCQAIDARCVICVYGETKNGSYGCLSRPHYKTYNDIDNAETPKQLFGAYRRRAAHMRKHYADLFIENDKE